MIAASTVLRAWRPALAAALLGLAAACATVPPVQHAFAVGRNGGTAGRPLPCAGAPAPAAAAAHVEALPGPLLRVTSWNLHKNGDAGWDADFLRFATGSDLLLIQEAALTPPLQALLDAAGFDGLLASAFTLNGRETGVLTAARVPPVQACVQRRFEPLLRLPKSAVITRYRVAGLDGTLAVANVHAINFALGLGDYRRQLEAIAHELGDHHGPVIVAGDFNTWNAARLHVVAEVMSGLGLASVLPPVDTRTRFLGQQVDFVFVRGFDVLHAEAPEVASSDHNPVLATLRLADPRRAE